MHGYCATDSYRGKHDVNWRHRMLTRLNPLCENPERQCLCLRNGRVSARPILHDSREFGDLCYPATVFFLLCLNRESHIDSTIAKNSLIDNAASIRRKCLSVSQAL